MTVRQMTESDREQAAALWLAIFGDSEAFTKWYFQNRFCPEYSFAAFDGTEMIAMTLGRPTTIRVEGRIHDALMISGVSTLPAYRGRGWMHRLVSQQIERARAARFSCCYLHPVAESLYARLGFQNGTDALIIHSKDGSNNDGLTIREEENIQAMRSVYDALLDVHDGMQIRDRAEFALQLQDYACDGSHTLIAYDSERPIGYIVYLDDHTVTELFALRTDAYESLLNEAARRIGEPLTATVPTDCGIAGERVYSMQYLVFDDAFSLPLNNGFCRLSY